MDPMREWRKLAGVTQAEAARTARCSHGTIGNFEHGRTRLTDGQVRDLLNLYDQRLTAKISELQRKLNGTSAQVGTGTAL